MNVLDQVRSQAAWVSGQATHVRVDESRIAEHATQLAGHDRPPQTAPGTESPERGAAYWLTLDAVNFGSGWFPTLLKMPEMTGYRTIKAGIDRRFKDDGPWPAQKLRRITMAEISTLMMQEPDHPLMPLFKTSLRDLGAHIEDEYGGRFTGVVDAADGSAARLVEVLGGWDCFTDSSEYKGRTVPFLKRAQLVAADLARAHVASWDDIDHLTLFADNLVPHVLRLDGVLEFEDELVRRIASGELIEHGSAEEVEMRACAVHAVELMAQASGQPPWLLDELLWNRGQQPRYKSILRPRSRSTAY